MKGTVNRRCLALCLLFALLLPGCGPKARKDDSPLTLNPDGTLGNLRWGMRYAEAAKADSRIILGSERDPNEDSCVVEFLGRRWTLTLCFEAVDRLDGHLQDGVHRLTRLVLSPLEAGSWTELAEPLEAVLGPRNITARYADPEWDEAGRFSCSAQEDLPQWAWAWGSRETLGSRLTDRELAAAYPYAEDLGFLRWGTPLSTVYFQLRDAHDQLWYSYQTVELMRQPAAPETELPAIVMEGEYAVEAQLLKALLRSEETERPPFSYGFDLSSARLTWQGEDYCFTGAVLDKLPGTGLRDTAILVGAVKPAGTREELTGNLDGYVYMLRNQVFPLYFRWREWDAVHDGPEPYLVFSLPKGG